MISKAGRLLFSSVFILIAIGIVMTYSASAIYADRVYANPQHFLIRQCLFVLIGIVVMFVAASIPGPFWKKYARAVILFSIILVALVFLPGLGYTGGGARRWIHLGSIHFQPAEFAKVAVCIYLADYLSRKTRKVKRGSLLIFLPPVLLVGVLCVLILLQPDLGSCAFLLLMTAVMLFIAGIQLRYVIAAAVVFLPVFYFLVIRVPYRLSRVTAYINPWDDPRGSGFQMIQSFLAFGIGGLQGVGLGQSTQKLFYLPSSYNDFILAIVGEELGLIGVFLILALFAVILFCGILIARRSVDFFEKLLALSLTLSIVLQAVINAMVATGLLPTKGLPLPFISYGGTSIVINLLSVGILLAIDRYRRPALGLNG